MKVRLIVKGYGEHTFEGAPLEVLRKADEVVVEWKVRFHGEEEG